jgi:hypothetical protein
MGWIDGMTCVRARDVSYDSLDFAYYVISCSRMLQAEGLQFYYEGLVERVGAEDEEVDLQIDHMFTLCKYIANDHKKVRP